jgi:predicted lipoprotein with Yx(FWY)xxD motif
MGDSHMTRMTLARLAAVLALAGALAIPIASASASARAGGGAKISLRKTSLGKILVNARGRTLYAFTKDAKNKDRCMSTSGCTSTWPVVTTKGKPRAGAGVKASMLGSITLSDRSHQVTYGGRPLYTYAADTSAGATDYVGATEFGGTWLAVNAAGKTLK